MCVVVCECACAHLHFRGLKSGLEPSPCSRPYGGRSVNHTHTHAYKVTERVSDWGRQAQSVRTNACDVCVYVYVYVHVCSTRTSVSMCVSTTHSHPDYTEHHTHTHT